MATDGRRRVSEPKDANWLILRDWFIASEEHFFAGRKLVWLVRFGSSILIVLALLMFLWFARNVASVRAPLSPRSATQQNR